MNKTAFLTLQLSPSFILVSPKYSLHKLISAKVEVIERISRTLWSLFH